MTQTEELLQRMKGGAPLTRAQRFRLVLTLSIPSILAQTASVIMGYIDAAMVGRLGAEASASISLVSTSTWLFGGIADAAATLSGQSLGAGRKELTRKFSRLSVKMGILVMTAAGALMFAAAPLVMSFLTPVRAVQDAGIGLLRIEAFAEPLYGASIVAAGALRGVGDTLVPSIMNFGSIWLVRLPLAILLSVRIGLEGVWIAMCLELCFRGIIFLIRLYRGKWLEQPRAVS